MLRPPLLLAGYPLGPGPLGGNLSGPLTLYPSVLGPLGGNLSCLLSLGGYPSGIGPLGGNLSCLLSLASSIAPLEEYLSGLTLGGYPSGIGPPGGNPSGLLSSTGAGRRTSGRGAVLRNVSFI